MAIEARNINPVDLKRSTGIGVSIPFSGLAVFNTTYTTDQAIKNNLLNYLLTRTNERVFNPNFGASIQTLVFEALTDKKIQEFKSLLEEQIKRQFPDIDIQNIDITSNPDLNTLYITVAYIITRYRISDELTIEFN
jgi:phage baseplate assembly protein W